MAAKVCCDVCGKDLKDVNGRIIAAEHIKIQTAPGPNNAEEREWAVKYMHPYKTDFDYYVCIPCKLKALGVGTAD